MPLVGIIIWIYLGKKYWEVFLMNIKCKKVCIIFVICLLLFGCSNENKYEKWYRINLEGCGTMMIPESFELKKEQDMYYIENMDNNEIELLGYPYKKYETKDDIKFSILNYDIYLKNPDDDSEYVFDCQSFSNSATFGEKPVIVNGEPTKQFFIDTSGDKKVDWITTPESSLDYDEIKKITESYELE